MRARLLSGLAVSAAAALAPLGAGAQGFAGLGGAAEGFAEVVPGRAWSFPADHGAHPEYRVEWWYLTANLTDASGRDYGLQWTLFRTALAPDGPQVWFAHAAATSENGHWSAERLARGDIGQAGVIADPFEAHIDEWRLAGDSLDQMTVTAGNDLFYYDMTLSAEGPLVLQGEGGFSVKSEDGQASWYYSQPFFAIDGVLTLPDGTHELSGRAWLDREFSSRPLGADQEGWDWFGLSLAGGERLMAFVLRGETPFTAATWIEADGTAHPGSALVATPTRSGIVAGREVPLGWHLVLEERGLDVEVTPVFDGAWMEVRPPYWEGPVRVSGSHEGRGYLEMTGHE